MSQTAPTPCDAAPDAPSTSSPSTFDTKADAFVAWIVSFVTQINALATNVYNNAVDCYNNAVSAASSAAAALAASNASAWVNGQTYARNDVAISQVDFQAYRKKTASSVTTIDPASDATNWQIISGDASKSGIQSQTYTAYTAGGTAAEATIVPAPEIASYAAGIEFDITFPSALNANATLRINNLASPPNLVKQNRDGSYSNIESGDVPAGWRSKIVMISATQALLRSLPPVQIAAQPIEVCTASSSATLDFTNLSGYKAVMFVISGILPANNGDQFYARISTDNGSTWKAGASDYRWCTFDIGSNGGTGAAGSNGDAQMYITGATGNTATVGGINTGTMLVSNLDSSAIDKAFTVDTSKFNGTNFVRSSGLGLYAGSQAEINGVRFFFSTGVIASGSIIAYGWK